MMSILAQKASNLVVFAEDATPFYVIVNGIKQNVEPQTNVKITGLTNQANQVRVVFKNTSLPSLNQQVYFQEMGVEATMRITNTKKGYKLRYFGEVPLGTTAVDNTQWVSSVQATEPTVNTGTGGIVTTTVVEEVVTTTTSTPVNTNVNVGVNGMGTTTTTTMTGTPETVNMNTNMNVGGMGTSTTTTVNENSTTTGTPENINMNTNMNITGLGEPINVGMNANVNSTTTPTGSGENVNVGMNVGGIGFNMNVNVTESGMGTNQNVTMNESNTVTTHTSTGTPTIGTTTNGATTNVGVNSGFGTTSTNISGGNINSTTSTTTTTTSSSSSTGVSTNNATVNTTTTTPVYYVEGYSGAVGCAVPQTQIDKIKSVIEAEAFSEDKMSAAKQATKNKCLTTAQVIEIAELFAFENEKLDYVKYAYAYTYDVDNFYEINSIFDFSSTKEDLNKFLSTK
jgi:hypothetical protein